MWFRFVIMGSDLWMYRPYKPEVSSPFESNRFLVLWSTLACEPVPMPFKQVFIFIEIFSISMFSCHILYYKGDDGSMIWKKQLPYFSSCDLVRYLRLISLVSCVYIFIDTCSSVAFCKCSESEFVFLKF